MPSRIVKRADCPSGNREVTMREVEAEVSGGGKVAHAARVQIFSLHSAFRLIGLDFTLKVACYQIVFAASFEERGRRTDL